MANLALLVTPRRHIIPATQDDVETLRLCRPNSLLLAKTSQPRNLLHHRKFRALAKMVAANHGTFTSDKPVIDMMKIRARFCDTIIGDGGEIFYNLKSLSFAECDQVSFDRFYKFTLDDLFVYWAPGVPEDKRDAFIEAALHFSE